MKVTLESTTKIVKLTEGSSNIECRIWEGKTESGISVHAYIPRIAAHQSQDLAEFEAELIEQRKPSFEVEAIPLRLIL